MYIDLKFVHWGLSRVSQYGGAPWALQLLLRINFDNPHSSLLKPLKLLKLLKQFILLPISPPLVQCLPITPLLLASLLRLRFLLLMYHPTLLNLDLLVTPTIVYHLLHLLPPSSLNHHHHQPMSLHIILHLSPFHLSDQCHKRRCLLHIRLTHINPLVLLIWTSLHPLLGWILMPPQLLLALSKHSQVVQTCWSLLIWVLLLCSFHLQVHVVLQLHFNLLGLRTRSITIPKKWTGYRFLAKFDHLPSASKKTSNTATRSLYQSLLCCIKVLQTSDFVSWPTGVNTISS